MNNNVNKNPRGNVCDLFASRRPKDVGNCLVISRGRDVLGCVKGCEKCPSSSEADISKTVRRMEKMIRVENVAGEIFYRKARIKFSVRFAVLEILV